MRVEHGETVIVGVNRFADGASSPIIPTPDFSALEREQVERLKASRGSRDATRVSVALGALRDAAKSPGSRLVPLIVDAARARASVGEIADSLRGAWGEYRPG
jgi:methylmalonyl-CoA mutase N-terminal domain/subunit